MAYCSHCGAELGADARFCSSCGNPAAAPSDAAVPPTVHVKRRENPLTQGVRYGTTGCVGCLVFLALAVIALALLVRYH